MLDLGPRLGDGYTDTLAHVLALQPKGYALEFGVASGRTLRMIAEHMPVVGFDSFDGLPEDWRDGFPAGRFACPVPDVPGAEIVVGLFEDTLPAWKPPRRKLGLLHLDADLYSSTRTVLAHVGRLLKPGAYVVMDEHHGYPGHEAHEARAWHEWVEEAGVDLDVIGHGPEQLAVRIR